VTALVLDAVSKRFGGVVAAAGVSMAVPPGRITGMIGPNGAGKTTVVNLITGMLAVDGGRILFGERDITRAPAAEVGSVGIARTFQNIRLLPEGTVIDNVMIGFYRHQKTSLLASLLGLPGARRESAELRERGMQLLASFGLSGYADHLAGGLAYGHQRRVEMMRALASEPEVLLLDEPVAGMNDVEAQELGEIFTRLADGGMAVLLIEHNLRFVTRLCSHVFVLDGGRLIAEGAPREVVENPAVVAAYIGT